MIESVVTCLGVLFLCGLARTLQGCMKTSLDAGIDRFEEKYPKAHPKWERHWRHMCGLLHVTNGGVQIVCIAYVSIFAVTHELPLFTTLVVFFPFYLLFAKLIPEALSEHYADRISVSAAPVILVLTRLFYPLAAFVSRIQLSMGRHMEDKSQEEDSPTTEDEIRTLVEQNSGNELEEDEKQIIRSALEFGDTITREVMTPRVRMTALEDSLTIDEAVAEIAESAYSRFPVFQEDYDTILGLIHAKDLMKALGNNEGERPLAEYIHPPLFAPESMPINDLLQKMKLEKASCAIIVDEYGGTAGILTLEDILEELVGEIEDEHDEEPSRILIQMDGSYLIDPSLPLDEINAELELELPESDAYDSLGGYLLFQFGRIPDTGEQFSHERAMFEVSDASARRIKQIRIRIA